MVRFRGRVRVMGIRSSQRGREMSRGR